MYNKDAELYNITAKWMSEGLEKVDKTNEVYKLLGVDLTKEPTYTLELTQEELDFIQERCSRKAQRLEEAGLKDIPCYRLSWQVMSKISKLKTIKEKV